MKRIITLIYLLTVLASCNKVSNEFSNEESNQITLIDSFEYKMKNEPKIFLDFWDGMTKIDFERVVDTLNRKKILKSYYFQVTDDLKYSIEPIIYKNNIIGGILIKGDNSLYELYKIKYNLPKLAEISNVSSVIFESNPTYLIKDLKEKSQKIDLKGDFISNSSLDIVLGDKNYVHQNSSFGEALETYKEKVVPSEQILDLDNFTLKIYNVKEEYDTFNMGDSHNGYPVYYYSGIKTFNSNLNKYELKADEYNSKSRYVVNTFTNKIHFEYLGKKYLKYLRTETEKKALERKNEVGKKKRKYEEVYNNI